MSSKKIQLKIITPEDIVYDSGDIDEISIPTEAGEITVLPNHSPLVSIIKTGEIRLKKSGERLGLAISKGILEVRPDSQIVILADRSEHAHDIDVDRAEDAYGRARDLMMKKEEKTDIDFARFEVLMEKELNRVKVAKRWR